MVVVYQDLYQIHTHAYTHTCTNTHTHTHTHTHTGLISPSDSQCDDEGSFLVLLNPQWLARIMTKVVELEIGMRGFGQKALKHFEETGTVGIEVLKQCWAALLGSDPDAVLVKLCHILKAFFLLYPCKSPSEESLYLVPSKLPQEPAEVPFTDECYTFYFEFPLYLPEEVYTHLVCVLLESSSTSCEYELTSTSCVFCPVLDFNWKVTLLASEQRLKVQARSVVP